MDLKDIKSKQQFVRGYKPKKVFLVEEGTEMLKTLIDLGCIIESQKDGQLANGVNFSQIKVYWTGGMAERAQEIMQALKKQDSQS